MEENIDGNLFVRIIAGQVHAHEGHVLDFLVIRQDLQQGFLILLLRFDDI